MMYRPSNSILERIRGLFKRRVGDAMFAYLGDSHGDGARVDVPGKIGFVYIHFPNGKDENGNALYSTPMIARATGMAYLNFPGAGVYVAYGYDGELEIKSAHYAGLDQAGIDTRVLNPLNQQSKFVYPWRLTYGLANAVATTLTGSFLVTVKSFRHYVGNTFQKFETPLQADKIDLESYVPGTNEHRYAAIWIDTYTNTPTVTTSTTQPLDEPLDYTDIQELVTGRPADAMPLKAFYLSDDQSTLRQTAREVDLRQHMATPTPWGFPHALTSLERVRPNYTLVVGPYTASGGGALTIETGGRVLNVHKSNVSASAPTVNDDSDDGYDIGSRWLNTTTGILYIATAVTVGAAVWTAIAGSGAAPATATYLLQVANADLPNAQAMGALGTGLVKNTTTTGVQSIAVAGTDYTTPTGTENLQNKTITLSSLIATALSLLIGGFNAIFTHANSADRTYTLPDASGAVALTSDIVTPPFVDTQTIIKGSADATKLLRFEVDGFTTGTTRVMTPPDYDGTLATLAGTETLTNKTLTSPKINQILDSNGNEEVIFTTTASAVNELTVTNAATGNKPKIEATGGDANIGLDILPKGTGVANIDGAATFNESGADRDFRVETDNNANTLFVDGGNDNVGMGTGTPNAGALLHLVSTTKASIPAPSMTAAQRDAIASPAVGMMAFVSDQLDLSLYRGDWYNLYSPFRSFMLNPFSEHTIVSGAALIWTSNTSQAGAGYYQRSAIAINDEIEWLVAFPTGTYHIEYMAVKSSNSGIMTFLLDGGSISSHDLYAAVTALNTRGSSSNFNVDIGSVKTLTIRVSSKNASSSNYATLISWLQIIRTAEYP
jgi:hypothetical protein